MRCCSRSVAGHLMTEAVAQADPHLEEMFLLAKKLKMKRKTTISISLGALLVLVSTLLEDANSFSTVRYTDPSRRQRNRREHLSNLQVSPEPLTSAIDSFFQTQPYIAAFLTCSLKAGTADFVAQAQQPQLLTSDNTVSDDDGEDENEQFTYEMIELDEECIVDDERTLDLARNVAFIVYGGVYQGLFQEFLYGSLFPVWFGNDGSFQTVATSVLADQFVFAPFTCLPCAYIIKAFIMNSDDDEMESANWSTTAVKGLSKYKEDVLQRGLLLKYWAIWFPVQTITFSVIPERYRILFIACVSFFWMFLLSAISSDTTSTSTKEESVVDLSASSGKDSSTVPPEQPLESAATPKQLT